MKFLPVSIVTALLAVAASAQFTINTPASVVECEPLLISWSGGTGPFFLSVEPGGQPSAPALENLGTQSGTSFTWTVNIAAGQSIGFTLRDSTGAIAQTAPVTVQAGGGTACLTATTSATASGSGSVAPSTPLTTSGSPTVSPPATTPTTPATTPTTPTTAGTTSHTSSTASTSSTSNAAAPTARYAQIGVAGVLGAVVAAIVA